LNEAAAARLHADTKSSHVLIANCAEFAAAAARGGDYIPARC
jgi:hypothetical protein